MKFITYIFILVFSFVSCKKEAQTMESKIVENTKPIHLDSDLYTTSDFNGIEHLLHLDDDKIHLVNFWATWCAPCVKEIPYFEKLKKENDNVDITLVSIDFNPKHLIAYLKKNPLESKVIYLDDTDQNTWIPKVDSIWSGAIPGTLIYSKNKRIFFGKSFTYEELKKEIDHFNK